VDAVGAAGGVVSQASVQVKSTSPKKAIGCFIFSPNVNSRDVKYGSMRRAETRSKDSKKKNTLHAAQRLLHS
jgi:hypothetical protein